MICIYSGSLSNVFLRYYRILNIVLQYSYLAKDQSKQRVWLFHGRSRSQRPEWSRTVRQKSWSSGRGHSRMNPDNADCWRRWSAIHRCQSERIHRIFWPTYVFESRSLGVSSFKHHQWASRRSAIHFSDFKTKPRAKLGEKSSDYRDITHWTPQQTSRRWRSLSRRFCTETASSNPPIQPRVQIRETR